MDFYIKAQYFQSSKNDICMHNYVNLNLKQNLKPFSLKNIFIKRYRFEWWFERLDVKIFLNFVFRKSKFGRAITARCHGHQHSGKETIGAHKPARAQSEWNHYQPSPATDKQRPTLVWSNGASGHSLRHNSVKWKFIVLSFVCCFLKVY